MPRISISNAALWQPKTQFHVDLSADHKTVICKMVVTTFSSVEEFEKVLPKLLRTRRFHTIFKQASISRKSKGG